MCNFDSAALFNRLNNYVKVHNIQLILAENTKNVKITVVNSLLLAKHARVKQ